MEVVFEKSSFGVIKANNLWSSHIKFSLWKTMFFWFQVSIDFSQISIVLCTNYRLLLFASSIELRSKHITGGCVLTQNIVVVLVSRVSTFWPQTYIEEDSTLLYILLEPIWSRWDPIVLSNFFNPLSTRKGLETSTSSPIQPSNLWLVWHWHNYPCHGEWVW